MGFTAEQRRYYYDLESARTGIHPPILAALYAVHKSPRLPDAETGLGIAPANQIALGQVSTFAMQVQYAANTIRSLTDRLTAQGWTSSEFWEPDQGRYSDRFLRAIAEGYAPPASDPKAARLEPTTSSSLRQVYLELADSSEAAPNLAFLDKALLAFAAEVPMYYIGLFPQRDALLEAVRLWRKLDTQQAAIDSLQSPEPAAIHAESLSDLELDQRLLCFIQPIASFYNGFPHQREALLRLVQRWRQLPTRSAAIASLQTQTSAETPIQTIDSALIAFVQEVPRRYQGNGEHRNALTECLRIWQGLSSRAQTLTNLGINPQWLAADRTAAELVQAATHLDRQLLSFARSLPTQYNETEQQREALIRLVQLWRGLPLRDKTIQSLIEDWQHLGQPQPGALPPKPEPTLLPSRPHQWTPQALQLHAPIAPNGTFTWAAATAGGQFLPTDAITVDAIARLAPLAEQIAERLGCPLQVVGWYHPSPSVNHWSDRHAVGDALLFYCHRLTSNQVYWALDPWWTGGLGRYQPYPYLCYIDAGEDRTRWMS